MNDKNYQKKKNLKQRNRESKLLLYDLDKGSLMELNNSAKYIWSKIEDKTMDDLINDYAEHYGIEHEIAVIDVITVTDELIKNGFITEM